MLPPGKSRSDAIEQRIKKAVITRKIRNDQVRSLSFLCTSDKKTMDAIVNSGRQHEYARACVDFGKLKFGNKNVVSAVSHFDETTFHIHLTV
ncbi:MAG: plasmid recombination protein, partial [Prevotella sp.]|nr:plasmid recombination protein [Prevotella sp.]